MRWRLDKLLAPSHLLELDYPVRPQPRYGHGKPAHPVLQRIIEQNRPRYHSLLAEFMKYQESFLEVPVSRPAELYAGTPTWANGYFAALDAVALYGCCA
jgi:hypothetical protein